MDKVSLKDLTKNQIDAFSYMRRVHCQELNVFFLFMSSQKKD
jgi:hypothetical protein